MADEIIEGLQAMEANEPQANVYRAAEEYVSDQAYELMAFGDDEDFNILAELMKQAVLYGANWKEQQMKKDAVDSEACYTMGVPSIIISLPDGIKVRDKVKVIVIKED